MDLINELNNLTSLSESKRIKVHELDLNKEYKITFGKIIKSKCGNSVLVGLEGSLPTFLTKRYSDLISQKRVQDLLDKKLVVKEEKKIRKWLTFSISKFMLTKFQ